MRRFILLAALCAALAGAAQAQQPQREPPYRPQQPQLWVNGGGVPAQGAEPRFFAGEHGIGDVIAEIDLMPTRYGRLTQDVTVSNARHGSVTLAAQTRLRAYEQRMIIMGDGRPGRIVNTGAQWCTETGTIVCIASLDVTSLLATLGRGPIPDSERFNYDEFPNGLAQRMGRRWLGPEPIIDEEPINPAPVRRQIVIRSINADGVTISLNDITGEDVSVGPEGARLGYGEYGPNLPDFFAHPYSFTRVPGSPDRVMVTFTRMPI